MKMLRIIEFVYSPPHTDKKTILRFVPKKGVPGFSHRVIINDEAFSWLDSRARPSADAAQYFIEQFEQV